MNSGTQRFIKNALANIVNGGASAVLAVALPYFFVRIFHPVEFSLWVLVLQLAAYVNFLNFGVQVAIGRFVTHALSRERKDEAEESLAAGLQILSVLAGLALVVIAVIALLLPVMFRTIDPAMIGTARLMLIWVGGALAIGLPFTAFLGVFIGLQRNEIPAGIAIVSKGALALALIVVAWRTHSLVDVAIAYFVVSIAGYALHYVVFKRVCKGWRIRLRRVQGSARKEMVSYCLSSSAWTLAMLLTRGLDTTIVGIFDFKNVAAYGVGSNLIALFVGLLNSAIAPILQVFTKYHARDDGKGLSIVLASSSSLVSVIVICMACWVVLDVNPIFKAWVGSDMAVAAVPIFVVLIFANALRNTAGPFSVYLWAAGKQRMVYYNPFLEGASNLIASVLLAKYMGAIGVAWGTAIGAVAGIAGNYIFVLKRTLPRELSIRQFTLDSLGFPFLLAVPMLAVLLGGSYLNVSKYFTIPCMLVASVPSVMVALRKYRNLNDLKRFAAVSVDETSSLQIKHRGAENLEALREKN